MRDFEQFLSEAQCSVGYLFSNSFAVDMITCQHASR